jgi:SnoaL-like domain
MAVHTELTPTEAADRLALRELFDTYAHCADRRDAEGQKALFTHDTVFAVYRTAKEASRRTSSKDAQRSHPSLTISTATR